MHNPLPLAGKRALVTGAARGIGAAIALKLAEDGADVVITYEKSAERAATLVTKMETLRRNAAAIQADAASSEVCKNAVGQTAARLGGLDILVTTMLVCFSRALLLSSRWRRSICS